MDDKLYNQIFLKPRFELDFDMDAYDLLTKLKQGITNDSDYKVKIVDHHVIIDIPTKDNHLWSPQLQLELVEKENDTTKIKGLFGPKPQLWTFFMFIHFAVATLFLVFAVIAYSNWSLQKDMFFSVAMLIVLPVIWIFLYLIGWVGKSTGQGQMDELKNFTKKLLKEVKVKKHD